MIEELIEDTTERKARYRQAHFSRPLLLFSLRIDRIANSGGEVEATIQTTESGRCPDSLPLVAPNDHRILTVKTP